MGGRLSLAHRLRRRLYSNGRWVRYVTERCDAERSLAERRAQKQERFRSDLAAGDEPARVRVHTVNATTGSVSIHYEAAGDAIPDPDVSEIVFDPAGLDAG